jgi:conjugative relaxase-like TrwC/TraI family protein
MLSKGKKIGKAGGAAGAGGAAIDYWELEDGFGPPSPGQWFNPTGRFGLGAAVRRDEFTNLFAGRDPHTARPLVSRIDRGRMSGMEFVCSPPKDFSVLWSAGNAEQRRMLEGIHDRAVERLLLIAQRCAARSRIGAGGRGGQVKAALVAAVWKHYTNREADPQLHSHIAIANLAIVPGKLRTLEFRNFLEWRGALSATYRLFVAEGLATLGVRVEREGRNFILPDVPRGLVAEQSTRRRLMEAFHVDLVDHLRAQAEGGPTPISDQFGAAIPKFLSAWRADRKPSLQWRDLSLDDTCNVPGYADAVALATRGEKRVVSAEDLEAEWAAMRVKYGFTIDQVLGRVAPPRPSTVAERAAIVGEALAELIEQSAVLEERNVIRVVAEHAQGRLTYSDVELALREAQARNDLICLRDDDNKRLYTTLVALEREQRMVSSGHEWSRSVDGTRVSDYLGEKRLKEILAERVVASDAIRAEAQREAAKPDFKEVESRRLDSEPSLADLVGPVPPLNIPPDLVHKFRQIMLCEALAHSAAEVSVDEGEGNVPEFGPNP